MFRSQKIVIRISRRLCHVRLSVHSHTMTLRLVKLYFYYSLLPYGTLNTHNFTH